MKLFNNPKGVVIIVVTFLCVFVLSMFVPKCHAADASDPPHVQFSLGSAAHRGTTPVLDVTFTTPSSQLRNAFWQGSLTIIGDSNYNGQDVRNNAVLRGLFVDGLGHFDVGLGVSWMVNPLPYNAEGGFNFNLQMDYRFTKLPITLTYTHLSNGGIRLPNLGRDLLLIGWRFH